MIVLITLIENDEMVVDYGVNVETDEIIVMPPQHPEKMGAIFDNKLNEYILIDTH